MDAKFIFIEGPDRAGKTSLINAIHKATNYKHVIFDRGVFSNMVYSTTSARCNIEIMKQYEKLENQLLRTNHLVIYLTCETEELEKRVKETNHEPVDFESHKALFDAYVNTTKLTVAILDSTHNSPEELAKKLLELNLV